MTTPATAEQLAAECKRLAVSMMNAALDGAELTAASIAQALSDAVDELAAMAKAAEGAERLAQRDTMTLQEVWDLAGGAHAMEGPTRHQVECLLHELDAPRPQQVALTDERLLDAVRSGLMLAEGIKPDHAGWVRERRISVGRAVERAHGILASGGAR